MFHFYHAFSVCREPYFSFTRFRKPCCGLDLRSGEKPLGGGAGYRTRRFLPRPSRAHAPLTFLLAEASPDTRRGRSPGAKTPERARTTLGVLPSFGGQTCASLSTASSAPFRSALSGPHGCSRDPRAGERAHLRQPDPAPQLTQREEPAVPRQADSGWSSSKVGQGRGREYRAAWITKVFLEAALEPKAGR